MAEKRKKTVSTGLSIQEYMFFARQNMFWLLLITIGVLFLFFSFQSMVRSLIGIPDLFSSMQTAQQTLTDRQEKLQILQKTPNVEYASMIQDAMIALPTEKDVGGIVYAMQQMQDSMHVNVGKFSLVPGLVSSRSADFVGAETIVTTDIPRVSGLSYTISISGSSSDIIAYLYKLTTVRRLFGIRSIKATMSDDGTSMTADLELLAYFMPRVEAKDNVKAPLTALSDKELAILKTVDQYMLMSNVTVSGSLNQTGRTDLFGDLQEPEASPEATGSAQ